MSPDDDTWKDLYRNAQEPDNEDPPEAVLFYNEQVIDHFTCPRNVGEIDSADGFALFGDPHCGDQMKLWIAVRDGYITDIKFKSFGCPGAIATSSMVTVLAMGKALEEAKALTDDDVIQALGGIPANKAHCSLMGIGALQAAIRDFEQRLAHGS